MENHKCAGSKLSAGVETNPNAQPEVNMDIDEELLQVEHQQDGEFRVSPIQREKKENPEKKEDENDAELV